MTDIALLFSGGKDSVLSLEALARDPGVRSVTLVATLTEDDECLTMHRVPREILESQAASLRRPIRFVRVPRDASNAAWEERMGAALESLRAGHNLEVATGDLHLAQIRDYRERWLATHGLRARFPLWGIAPASLARRFVSERYRATIVCVDVNRLPSSLSGAPFDASFVDQLPEYVDPCGENGEFHSFVHDGPGFAFPVPVLASPGPTQPPFAWASLTLGATEQCTRCGARFTCAARTPDVACWCVRVPPVTPDPLAAGCLCPRCLAGIEP